MTVIIIISVIILIFAFLLNVKIKAEISYISGIFNFKVKYLCFTLFPFKEKKKKKAKKSKSKNNPKKNASNSQNHIEQTDDHTQDNTKKTDKSPQNQTAKTKEPLSDKIDKLFDVLEKVKIIWSVSQKHLLNIFKHIYIEELMIDFTIADEDAYNTAINYGKINAGLYNLINFIRTFFSVTIKTVDIICDFDSHESIYDFSAKITVKPATILSAVFGILFGLLINLKKLISTKNTKHHSDKEAVSM